MLVRTDPPQESVDALARELTLAVEDGRLGKYLDQPVRSDRLTASAPHPFYVLDINDISEDDATPLNSRHSGWRGWRYLLEVNRRPVAIATTAVDDEGLHHVEGIATGPAVGLVVYAVHVADELLRHQSEAFSMAAVDIPAAHTVLLKVSDWSGESTAFLPIGLATSLHPAHFYSSTQIRVELQKLAAQVDGGRVPGAAVGG
jgi:hypothetical protein